MGMFGSEVSKYMNSLFLALYIAIDYLVKTVIFTFLLQ